MSSFCFVHLDYLFHLDCSVLSIMSLRLESIILYVDSLILFEFLMYCALLFCLICTVRFICLLYMNIINFESLFVLISCNTGLFLVSQTQPAYVHNIRDASICYQTLN